jgi:hypothetical protein
MPNPAVFVEPGNRLPLISLGGVVSLQGQGRIVTSTSVVATAPIVLASANPKRISAIIQNCDDGANPGMKVYVFMGTATPPIILLPYGTLQIDRDFPWIGDIIVGASANNPVVTMVEIGLQ